MKPILLSAVSAFLAASLSAQEPEGGGAPAEPTWEEASAAEQARIDAAFPALRAEHADTNRWFAAPGVLADRGEGTVRVDAMATGLRSGSIAEFLLITLNSRHEYESLFQTAALAADIARAFEFLGLPPGRTVDYPSFRFWPAGELVHAGVSVDGAPEVPAETLLMDAATRSPREPAGFLWLGGGWTEGGVSNTVDFSGPGSVLPSYNETVSLFDVPRRARQTEVYQSCLAGTNAPARLWAPAVFVFRPEKRPEGFPRRVRDVALRLSPEGFAIDGGETVPPAEALRALRAFRAERAQDAYLSFSWDDALSVADLHAAAQLLLMVDKEETGIRVDRPPEGFPFYQAFLPQDAWRDRGNRFTQPCELRFSLAEDGSSSATLVAITEHWRDDSLKPDLSAEEIPVAGAADFRDKIAEKGPKDVTALLVFAPGKLPFGAMRPYLDAVRATHPTVQIFAD